MQRCKFCDDYRYIKKMEKKSIDRSNADPDCEVEIRRYYRVAIVSGVKRRIKNESSRWSRGGTSVHGRYPIRFCPMCGRKL
jgi:hypothetical protein